MRRRILNCRVHTGPTAASDGLDFLFWNRFGCETRLENTATNDQLDECSGLQPRDRFCTRSARRQTAAAGREDARSLVTNTRQEAKIDFAFRRAESSAKSDGGRPDGQQLLPQRTSHFYRTRARDVARRDNTLIIRGAAGEDGEKWRRHSGRHNALRDA